MIVGRTSTKGIPCQTGSKTPETANTHDRIGASRCGSQQPAQTRHPVKVPVVGCSPPALTCADTTIPTGTST